MNWISRSKNDQSLFHRFAFYTIFFNWANPCLFLFIFGLYKQTNQCEKCHVHPVYSAGIRTHTLSNMNHPPLPLDHGSRHYTTYLIHELVINKRQSENFITTLKMSLTFTPGLFYLLIFYAHICTPSWYSSSPIEGKRDCTLQGIQDFRIAL